MKKVLIWSAVLLGALSNGCGGGGGGGGSTAQSSPLSPSPPASQNQESVPTPPEPFSIVPTTLATSSGGNSYAGTYSETPNKGTTMFAGHEANSSTVSLTITENGSPIVTEIETAYYLENPYQPLGLTLSYNGGQFDFLYNSTIHCHRPSRTATRVRSARGLITLLIRTMPSAH
jgi:hypothetical protein